MIATSSDFRIGIGEIEKRRDAAERRLARLERTGASLIEITAARQDIERATAALATLNAHMLLAIRAEGRGRLGRHREIAPHLPPAPAAIHMQKQTRGTR